MAQSLHIGLQGPFTNLPFGIGKPSILTFKVNQIVYFWKLAKSIFKFYQPSKVGIKTPTFSSFTRWFFRRDLFIFGSLEVTNNSLCLRVTWTHHPKKGHGLDHQVRMVSLLLFLACTKKSFPVNSRVAPVEPGYLQNMTVMSKDGGSLKA